MLAHSMGVQGQVKKAIKTLKHPHLWRPPKRTPNPKLKKNFWLGTTRLAKSVEGFNTSLAAAAGELWPKECRPLQWPALALKGWEKHNPLSVQFDCNEFLYDLAYLADISSHWMW